MRVGIIALLQESNTFVAEATTLRHFENHLLARGEQVRAALADTPHEVGGFFERLARGDIEAVPIFAARALPFGTVTDETYAILKQQLLAELAAVGPLDGLLVAPHGATVSQTIRDVDGDWLAAVRDVVGIKTPIIATADPHGNLSSRMVKAVDAIIAYRTNPHLDQHARGLEAADLMVRTLGGQVRPKLAAAFPPLVINIDRQCTDEEPCRSICERIDEVRQRPGVLSASLFLGFPYADVPEMGAAIAVVADGSAALAEDYANELGRELWERREEFRPNLLDPDAAVSRAAQMPGPVCLLDMGDNVGGGSAADGTTLAHLFHQRRLGPAFICLYDPEAVRQAEAVGVGGRVAMAVGGNTDQLHGAPLEAEFTIESIADGKFEEPEARHAGMRYFDQGRTAIAHTNSELVVMLTSERMVPFSLHQLTDFGLNPQQFHFLVAKGVNAPLAAYAPVCPSILRVNTPGATTADVASLDYHYRRRPMFPFEGDACFGV